MPKVYILQHWKWPFLSINVNSTLIPFDGYTICSRRWISSSVVAQLVTKRQMVW